VQLDTEIFRRQSPETAEPSSIPPAVSSPFPDLSYNRRPIGAVGSKQILVIEDSTEIREFIVKVMSDAGFEADGAQDGEEGWRAICLTSYDLVITDHEMPRLTGLNLIRRLREVSAMPPCILISASLPEPESTLKELINPGAVLAKPFKAALLIEIVFSLLKNGAWQGT
jgi:two-component system chemotaxis response regulator CheY